MRAAEPIPQRKEAAIRTKNRQNLPDSAAKQGGKSAIKDSASVDAGDCLQNVQWRNEPDRSTSAPDDALAHDRGQDLEQPRVLALGNIEAHEAVGGSGVRKDVAGRQHDFLLQ